MIAARNGQEAVVQLLLKKGADIEAQDEDGETALMKAVRHEKECEPWKKSEYEAVIRLLTPNLES